MIFWLTDKEQEVIREGLKAYLDALDPKEMDDKEPRTMKLIKVIKRLLKNKFSGE